MKYKYTEEQRDFISSNVIGKSNQELVDLFNKRFNLQMTVPMMKSYKGNHRLSSGLDGRFCKGNKSWNKGTKGLTRSNKTSFKKGNTPLNHRPVGSTRVDAKDGYLLIKTAEPSTWKLLHRVIWEEANGSIPKGHRLIFLDGDKTNIILDNLQLASYAQTAVMSKMKLFKSDAELTKTGSILADVIIKTNKKMNDKK